MTDSPNDAAANDRPANGDAENGDAAEDAPPPRRFSQEQYDMLKRCSDKKDMTEWITIDLAFETRTILGANEQGP